MIIPYNHRRSALALRAISATLTCAKACWLLSNPSIEFDIRYSKKKNWPDDQFFFCGERGIRTPDTLPYTHFPGVRFRPLSHLSNFCLPRIRSGTARLSYRDQHDLSSVFKRQTTSLLVACFDNSLLNRELNKGRFGVKADFIGDIALVSSDCFGTDIQLGRNFFVAEPFGYQF